MEQWQSKLIELRELSEELTKIERKRQQINIIGKTISLKNELDVIERKLKSPARTAGTVKKHIRRIEELKNLYDTENLKAPLNTIKRETELITRLYNDLMQVYKSIISDMTDN